MLSYPIFVRRLLLTALPSVALISVACTDNDALSTDGSAANAGASASNAGRSGATGTAGAGNGAAGTAGSSGASGAAENGGAAGEAGASGAAGAAGTAGTSAEAGAAGETGAEDVIAPTVLSTSPLAGATGVATEAAIRVTFSEAMDASTLTQAFQVTLGGVTVPGTTSYFQRTATFTPDSAFALNETYHAVMSVAATDLAGNALAQAQAWNFTTATLAALGPAPVLLGQAGNYVVLAKSAITNVPTSAVTGNLGLSPAAASYITGFPLTNVGTYWTSPQVVGAVFAADNDAPTPSNLTTAVANLQAAYTDAASRPTPDFSNLGAGAIGGLTLVPGLYKWASSLTIPTDVTLAGAANDVWIFQVTGDLELSAAKSMILSGGAQAKNVFWQVAGAVDLGTTSHAEGVVLCKTAITLGTGSSINGRLLAQTAVNLASSTVTEPAL